MTSQPMTVSARSPECTSSSMAALKRDTVAAKTGYRSSVSRYQAAYTCTAQATSVTIADTVAKVGVDSKTKGRSIPGRLSDPTVGITSTPGLAASMPTRPATRSMALDPMATTRAAMSLRRTARPSTAAKSGSRITMRAIMIGAHSARRDRCGLDGGMPSG